MCGTNPSRTMSFSKSCIEAAAAAIAEADALLIGAGAGMGVDSGLPDFRGNDGFWRAYPALGRLGMRFHDVASPRAFAADPERAWGFYGHRLRLYRDTLPHAGFGILRRWGENMPRGYGVFTSNVDGQFQRAGFGDARLTECHGSIHHLQCTTPCSEATWPADDFDPVVDAANCRLLNDPPTCPWCGALARPNILMFGDGGWSGYRAQQQQNRLMNWLVGAGRLVIIEIGAGTAIPTVRHFSNAALQGRKATLVRINPREPQTARPADVPIAGRALETLQAIDQAAREA